MCGFYEIFTLFFTGPHKQSPDDFGTVTQKFFQKLETSQTFTANEQQDAHELLILLIDALRTDFDKITDKSRKTLAINQKTLKFPIDLITGRTVNCKNCKRTSESGFTLTKNSVISVKPSENNFRKYIIELNDLLKTRFGSPDTLHGAKCDRCKSDCVMVDLLGASNGVTKQRTGDVSSLDKELGRKMKMKTDKPAMYKLEALARCPQLAVIHVDRVTINSYTGYR